VGVVSSDRGFKTEDNTLTHPSSPAFGPLPVPIGRDGVDEEVEKLNEGPTDVGVVVYKEQSQHIGATSKDEAQKALLDTIVGLMADKVHLSSSLGAALPILNWDKSGNWPYFILLMMELV
jgi:hypothetical protein